MNRKELDYRKSDALREQLARLLADNAMVMALDALTARPDRFPDHVVGVHPDIISAREFSKAVGANDTINRLKLLTEKLPEGDPEKLLVEAGRDQWQDSVQENLPPDLAKIIKKYSK